MKPAPFEYHRPASLAETFDLLDRYGDDRNRIPDLDAIRVAADGP